MGNQSRHGGPAGGVGAEHLTQKHTQRYQRCKDTIDPADLQCYQRLLDQLRRKNVTERQIPILQILLLQKSDLLSKPSLVTMPHRWPPCRDGAVVELPSTQARLFLPRSFQANNL